MVAKRIGQIIALSLLVATGFFAWERPVYANPTSPVLNQPKPDDLTGKDVNTGLLSLPFSAYVNDTDPARQVKAVFLIRQGTSTDGAPEFLAEGNWVAATTSATWGLSASTTVGGLVENMIYYYRVTTVNDLGASTTFPTWGNITPVFSGVTVDAIPKVDAVALKNGADTRQTYVDIHFKFTGDFSKYTGFMVMRRIAGTEDDWVEYKKDPSLYKNNVVNDPVLGLACNNDCYLYRDDQALAVGEKYEYRVVAYVEAYVDSYGPSDIVVSENVLDYVPIPAPDKIGIEKYADYKRSYFYVHFGAPGPWDNVDGYFIEANNGGATPWVWPYNASTTWNTTNLNPDPYLANQDCASGPYKCVRYTGYSNVSLTLPHVFRVRFYVMRSGVKVYGSPVISDTVYAQPLITIPAIDNLAVATSSNMGWAWNNVYFNGTTSWSGVENYHVQYSFNGTTGWTDVGGSPTWIGNNAISAPTAYLPGVPCGTVPCRIMTHNYINPGVNVWYRVILQVYSYNGASGFNRYGNWVPLGPFKTADLVPVPPPQKVAVEATTTSFAIKAKLHLLTGNTGSSTWDGAGSNGPRYYRIERRTSTTAWASIGEFIYSRDYPVTLTDGALSSVTSDPLLGAFPCGTRRCYLKDDATVATSTSYWYRARLCAYSELASYGYRVCSDPLEAPELVTPDFTPDKLEINKPDSVEFTDTGYNTTKLKLNYTYQSDIPGLIRELPGWETYNYPGYEVNEPNYEAARNQIQVCTNGSCSQDADWADSGLQSSQYAEPAPYVWSISPNNYTTSPGSWSYALVPAATGYYAIKVKSNNYDNGLVTYKDVLYKTIVANSPENACPQQGVQHRIEVRVNGSYKGYMCNNAVGQNQASSEGAVYVGKLQAGVSYTLTLSWTNDYYYDPSSLTSYWDDIDSNVLIRQIRAELVSQSPNPGTLIKSDNTTLGDSVPDVYALGNALNHDQDAFQYYYLDRSKDYYFRARTINKYVGVASPYKYSDWRVSAKAGPARPAPIVSSLSVQDGSLPGEAVLVIDYDQPVSGDVIFERQYKLSASSTWSSLPDKLCRSNPCASDTSGLAPGRAYDFRVKAKSGDPAVVWTDRNAFILADIPMVDNVAAVPSFVTTSTIALYFNYTGTWHQDGASGYVVERKIDAGPWQTYVASTSLAFNSTTTNLSTVLPGEICATPFRCYAFINSPVIPEKQYAYRVALVHKLASSTAWMLGPWKEVATTSLDLPRADINPPASVKEYSGWLGSNLFRPLITFNYQPLLVGLIKQIPGLAAYNYDGYEVGSSTFYRSQIEYATSSAATVWEDTGLRPVKYSPSGVGGATSTLISQSGGNLEVGDQPGDYNAPYIYLNRSRGDYYLRARSINPYYPFDEYIRKYSDWTVSAGPIEFKPFPFISDFSITPISASTYKVTIKYNFERSGPTRFEFQASLVPDKTDDSNWKDVASNLDALVASSSYEFIVSGLPAGNSYFRIRPRGSDDWLYSAFNIADLSYCQNIDFAADHLVNSTTTPISSALVNEIRDKINSCLVNSLSRPRWHFTDEPLAAGRRIKADHVNELREAVDLIYDVMHRVDRDTPKYDLELFPPNWHDHPAAACPPSNPSNPKCLIKAKHFRQIQERLINL